jgi:hypothetical protein
VRVRRGVGHRVTRPELVGGHGQGSNVPAAPVEDGPWVEQVEVDPRVERVRLVRSRARARARAGLGLGLGLGSGLEDPLCAPSCQSASRYRTAPPSASPAPSCRVPTQGQGQGRAGAQGQRAGSDGRRVRVAPGPAAWRTCASRMRRLPSVACIEPLLSTTKKRTGKALRLLTMALTNPGGKLFSLPMASCAEVSVTPCLTAELATCTGTPCTMGAADGSHGGG